jgi:hypothetical protein
MPRPIVEETLKVVATEGALGEMEAVPFGPHHLRDG